MIPTTVEEAIKMLSSLTELVKQKVVTQPCRMDVSVGMCLACATHGWKVLAEAVSLSTSASMAAQ